MVISKIERVDEIPIVLHWLTEMHIAEIIDGIWQSHGNWQGLTYGQLGVLYITYIINSLTHTLSFISDWVKEHRVLLEMVTGWKIGEKNATDDRIGIMMSDFGNDTAKILEFHQQNGHQIIQAFELPTEIGRYDTTSVNVYHCKEGGDSGILNFGHSKDKRPNLLQFKQGLGVLDPAGIPIFSETISGNDADDPLYVPAWRQMAKTIGTPHFLFVSDCKGSAKETRSCIASEGGFYLIPLARTCKIPEKIEDLVKNPPVTPEDIILSDVKDKHGNPTKVGKGFVIKTEQECDSHTWTERWFVALSLFHASMKNKSRDKRLKKAETALNKLTPKSEEDVDSFSQRASKVLKKHSVENMIDINVEETLGQQKRFLKRGRPTPDTPFEIIETRQLQLNFTFNQEQIEKEELLAGWRIYATNTVAEQMTLELRYQYTVMNTWSNVLFTVLKVEVYQFYLYFYV